MFLEERVRVPLPVDDAQLRLLAHLSGDTDLQAASDTAFRHGRRVLLRAGAAGLTKQVQVHFLEPYERPDATVLPMRWVATGPAGGLFPQLDANIELSAAGPHESELALVGSYRPPFGDLGKGLDRLVLNQAAKATFRSLLRSLRAIVLEPEAAAAGAASATGPLANPLQNPLANPAEA